uniref:hypothetical protein n=1 Tax=Ningiella ruwaisensis TaxID=2364274 RepID=UPI00109F0B71|nr:hypothetical protein [Ningiella ruwaisensis]
MSNLHFIDINTIVLDDEPEGFRARSSVSISIGNKLKTTKWMIIFVSASVFIHALLIVSMYQVMHQVKVPFSENPSSNNSAPLESYIFVRVPETPKPSSQERTPEEIKPEQIKTEQNQDFPILKDSTNDANLDSSTRSENSVQAEPQNSATSDITVKQESKSRPLVNESASSPSTQILQNTATNTDANKSLPTDSLSSKHLNNKSAIDNAVQRYQMQQNAQAIQNMAEQEAKAYMRQKVSPDLNLPDFDSLARAEQREAALRKIEVDCANAAKKGISIITGLFGGTVQCRDNNEFQQYIDKHLNKQN